MSLLIFSTEFPAPLPEGSFQQLLAALPVSLRAGPLRFRRWEDAHANLLGKQLLLMALKAAGAPNLLADLRYTYQSKPYFPGGPHFNISHSGNRVICVLCKDGRVGIDIEAVKPIRFEDFQTQFTEKEWTAIRGAADPVTAFYWFWTAKESLIKADGRGLGIPLLELDVSEPAISLNGTHWTLHPLHQLPGYAAHVATEEPGNRIEFTEIPPVHFIRSV